MSNVSYYHPDQSCATDACKQSLVLCQCLSVETLELGLGSIHASSRQNSPFYDVLLRLFSVESKLLIPTLCRCERRGVEETCSLH